MKTYSINDIAELTGQNKETVRRFINRNNLKEYKPEDRKHSNSPKYYSQSVLNTVREHYTPKHNSSTTEAQQSATEKAESSAKSDRELIEVLKAQVENERKEKQELIKLLDQQQQLSLIAHKKAETLEIELKETKEEMAKEQKEEDTPEPKEKDKSIFDRIFKRNREAQQ